MPQQQTLRLTRRRLVTQNAPPATPSAIPTTSTPLVADLTAEITEIQRLASAPPNASQL